MALPLMWWMGGSTYCTEIPCSSCTSTLHCDQLSMSVHCTIFWNYSNFFSRMYLMIPSGNNYQSLLHLHPTSCQHQNGERSVKLLYVKDDPLSCLTAISSTVLTLGTPRMTITYAFLRRNGVFLGFIEMKCPTLAMVGDLARSARCRQLCDKV